MANRYKGQDPILTNISIGYHNDAYIARQIWPRFQVKDQTGKHFIYDRGRFRIEKTTRGIGAKSNEVTLSFTVGDPYSCQDHALKQFVPDDDVKNAVIPGAPFSDATENVTEKLLIEEEKALADYMTSTLSPDVTLSGTSQWSDYNNSDPISDLETGMQTIHSALFVNPNVLVLGRQAWNKIKHHPDFLERIKYVQKGVVGTDLLASLIGVDKVLVGGAGVNTAKEGQTDAMSYIWGKHAWFAYVNPKVGQKMVTFGLTYEWEQMHKIVERFRGTDEQDRRGTYVRVGDDYYDQQVVSTAAVYFLKNVIA